MLGYSTYAKNLETRVITGSWVTWGYGLNRMYYMPLYSAETEPWGHIKVGMEMRWKNRETSTRWGRDGDWIFRSYVDGIALYRPYQLSLGYLRYNAVRKIETVIDKHFTFEREIPDVEFRSGTHPSNYYKRTAMIKVYKRKPLSQIAREVYTAQADFGDRLVRKYNVNVPQEAQNA